MLVSCDRLRGRLERDGLRLPRRAPRPRARRPPPRSARRGRSRSTRRRSIPRSFEMRRASGRRLYRSPRVLIALATCRSRGRGSACARRSRLLGLRPRCGGLAALSALVLLLRSGRRSLGAGGERLVLRLGLGRAISSLGGRRIIGSLGRGRTISGRVVRRGRNLFAGLADHADRLADLDLASLGREDLEQHARRRRPRPPG